MHLFLTQLTKMGQKVIKSRFGLPYSFLCSPSRYLQIFPTHLKKNPCSGQSGWTVGKVLAETHTHCMLVTSGCSSVGLLSSSSHCCCSAVLCARKMLRHLLPGEVIEIRSLSRVEHNSSQSCKKKGQMCLCEPLAGSRQLHGKFGWLTL